MLKWAEFVDGDMLYEAFLPESDRDGGGWLLRAVRRAHIVAEREIPLIHRPTFGPDSADVTALEAALDQLIDALHSVPALEDFGAYEPAEISIAPPNPALSSSLFILKEKFLEAIKSLRLDADWVCALLGLREGLSVEQLYPMAITRSREIRMQRVVALRTLSETYPSLDSMRVEVLDAIRRDDVEALRSQLNAAGVRT